MHYPFIPWHPAPCNPCGGHASYHHWAGPLHACPPTILSYVPVAYVPHVSHDVAQYPVTRPQELTVDAGSSPQEALIGGTSDAHLSLEYLVEAGATTPEVTVTITSNGTTSTWTDTAIDPGYYHKARFMSVEPGAKATVEVKDAIARLRWCETTCC